MRILFSFFFLVQPSYLNTTFKNIIAKKKEELTSKGYFPLCNRTCFSFILLRNFYWKKKNERNVRKVFRFPERALIRLIWPEIGVPMIQPQPHFKHIVVIHTHTHKLKSYFIKYLTCFIFFFYLAKFTVKLKIKKEKSIEKMKLTYRKKMDVDLILIYLWH